jgi:hypothetical protein
MRGIAIELDKRKVPISLCIAHHSSSAMCYDCPPTPTIITQCDQILTEYFVRR